MYCAFDFSVSVDKELGEHVTIRPIGSFFVIDFDWNVHGKGETRFGICWWSEPIGRIVTCSPSSLSTETEKSKAQYIQFYLVQYEIKCHKQDTGPS
jgi:hypothetical protein